jgi:hypothetical protein
MLGIVAQPLWASDATGVSAADEANAAAFTAAIERLAGLDPHGPDMLDTRLRFADFLAKADGGNCALRLDNAQRQLEAVLANPANPANPANAAALRARQLQAALESAQRSGAHRPSRGLVRTWHRRIRRWNSAEQRHGFRQ